MLPEQAALAVLGSPIAHSKSPAIHAAAYRRLGLDWTYGRAELQPDDLATYLADRSSGWRGFSLTMPLKEEAARLSGLLDPVAEESGVVNTLLRLDSEATPWAGFNTDVGGLAAALEIAGLDVSSTVIIGSGATAVSAIMAVRRLGAAHVDILARNVPATSDLVARFGDTREPGGTPLHVVGTPLRPNEPAVFGVVMPRPTLVISTLPGPAAAETQVPAELLDAPLFDVAYEPWPSPFALRWREGGGVAIPGVEMLVEQAILQIRIFMNGDPGAVLRNEDDVRASMRAAAGL
ncbi:MAG: shikimate dehydrogenase [Leucobacter sp.]